MLNAVTLFLEFNSVLRINRFLLTGSFFSFPSLRRVELNKTHQRQENYKLSFTSDH